MAGQLSQHTHDWLEQCLPQGGPVGVQGLYDQCCDEAQVWQQVEALCRVLEQPADGADEQ